MAVRRRDDEEKRESTHETRETECWDCGSGGVGAGGSGGGQGLRPGQRKQQVPREGWGAGGSRGWGRASQVHQALGILAAGLGGSHGKV